jgi:hypothetical protein
MHDLRIMFEDEDVPQARLALLLEHFSELPTIGGGTAANQSYSITSSAVASIGLSAGESIHPICVQSIGEKTGSADRLLALLSHRDRHGGQHDRK